LNEALVGTFCTAYNFLIKPIAWPESYFADTNPTIVLSQRFFLSFHFVKVLWISSI